MPVSFGYHKHNVRLRFAQKKFYRHWCTSDAHGNANRSWFLFTVSIVMGDIKNLRTKIVLKFHRYKTETVSYAGPQ
uniref:Ovule protein n=1 Tax=Echinococcus granulosus TaxID=6210 RepID=A0A068WNJ5_ECHGR|nr:hypothetical protein EgrG_000453700 [Echinococcus granulosus]